MNSHRLGIVLACCVLLSGGCSQDVQTKQNEVPRTPKNLTLDLGKGVTMKLVLIQAGKFLMGSPKTDISRDDCEGPQREVTIPQVAAIEDKTVLERTLT